MKKIFFLFVASLMIISCIGFCSSMLGCFKQNECFDIVTNINATGVNISGITTPSPSPEIIYINKEMTKEGSMFNLTVCNTSKLGSYTYGYCDNGGTCYNNNFKITPSGSCDIDSGAGLSFIGSLIVMLIIGIVFLFVGINFKNIAVKVSFISFAVIVLIMTLLFIVVSAQQNLYGFTGLVTGVETFWFITKFLIGIGVIALFIIVLLILRKAWKIKRGYIDK